MYSLTKEEFIKLSENGNVIPVYRELLADFDTPLSAFLKIETGEFCYLLESVEKGEQLGRYSFIGSNPLMVVESKDKKITVKKNGKIDTYNSAKDPIEELKKIMSEYKFVNVPNLPRFSGGMVGFIGYDMVRFFENLPSKNEGELNIADMQMILSDTILIFDHVDHKIKIVSNAVINGSADKSYDTALKKINDVVTLLKKNIPMNGNGKSVKNTDEVKSNFTKEAFCDMVEQAKEHIKRGDIIQIVLSQRFKRRVSTDSFSLYRALRSVNPSPYMFYLKFGENHVIGSSPEILVRCENNEVELRPIAGTRRRGIDEKEDIFLAEELLADPKERAEHVMLVDLGRNDIGRVCDFSSVRVKDVMRVERYSHVMHIVSDVTGNLNKDKDIYDLIRASFPAGTVTGAPKIKAMELIEKLENTKRALYAGCAGYISFSGNMDMCIAIRTILMKGETVYVQAGAGIVLDSIPEKEYEETINKAKAMIKAIEFAENGLE
ncbi:anthranilate synthase subunit I [Candidatus Omnitrophus magneticus]|uniref:Anthranilate synthase component 1 n=1 Tax=Candidatus Omnitrophus magneticus TaxID=1609969 RepID=A0A0F0CN60_9BACT|nr:anthranilate synthase subunit I [Candidatus Omnitrophus magneticus]